MERIFGTLIALTVIGNPCKSSAEPMPQRGRVVHEARPKESRAKTKLVPAALPGVEESVARGEIVPSTLLRVADANGDARVVRAELEALVQHHVHEQIESRFSRLDRNGDGRVLRSEVPSMDHVRFTRFDVNGDGAFTIAELAQVMEAQVAHRCRVLLSRYDVDGDGALTAADMEEVARQRYSKLETSRSEPTGTEHQ